MIQGALLGGGVGLGLAVVRPAGGEGDDARVVRMLKSVAEGALAGAAVGLLATRRRTRRPAR